MGVYALIDLSTGLVVNTIVLNDPADWYGEDGFIVVETTTASIGWTYIDGEFIAPPVAPPTPQQILESQSSKLLGFKQLAESQKLALSNRISTLQDAIDNIGVEGMEEFAATPEEQAEFPNRKSQLTKWKNYAILLGRVTGQAGWPPEVEWPVQPTEGMDLTVSAVAPDSLQLQ